jgi:hypothetical protein
VDKEIIFFPLLKRKIAMSKRFSIDNSSALNVELSTAQALCEIVDSPRALMVSLLIKYKEFQQIVDLDIDPQLYEDPQHFADDYLVTECLKKSPNLPLDIDKSQKARTAFFAAEACCKETNDRFCQPTREFSPEVEEAQSWILRILGPLVKNDLQYIEDHFRFGPGATTGVRGSGSVLSDKYDEEIHLTPSLYPFYRSTLGDRWWDSQKNPVIVEGNRFTTVPKNAKTDRGICIEPTLNIYGQLGIGACIRKKLKHFGINLNTQDNNRSLAKRAYSHKLCTIDLSSASDMISWSIVMKLLPPRWFELLDTFRSPYTLIDGVPVELEKFSSMGNGYTFELESLIFSAVAFACVPKKLHEFVSVYGDDIILPQAYATKLIDTLEFLGFSVNKQKSFLAGNFFESCGSDWFREKPVRPFYLRFSTGSNIPPCVQASNALRLYANRICGGFACDVRFKDLWVALYKASPSDWRQCKVPPTFGDTGIIVSYDESYFPKARGCIEGRIVRHKVFKPIKRRKTSFGRLLAALACPVPEISSRGFEPRRGYLRKPVTKRAIVSSWPRGFDWG